MTTTAEPSTTCPAWCVEHDEYNGGILHRGRLSKWTEVLRVQASQRDDRETGCVLVRARLGGLGDSDIIGVMSAQQARKLACYLLRLRKLADVAR